MKTMKTGVLLALFPMTCHAYIDPGFLGMVGQFAYLILFGLVGAFILRPYGYIKSLFTRKKNEPTKPADPVDSSDNGETAETDRK